MSGTETEYWDTCVFLALLKGESLRHGEESYLEQQSLRFDIGQLNLVTSAITITEILACKLTKEQRDRLREVSTRRNFQYIDANPGVCELASEIRNYYVENPPSRPEGSKTLKLMTPDSIHVASAIAVQTAIKRPVKLLTFDCTDKPSKGEMALDRLNGLVANKYRLTIGRPDVSNQQVSLTLIGGRAGLESKDGSR